VKWWKWQLLKLGLVVPYGIGAVYVLDLFLDGWQVVTVAFLIGWLALIALDEWRERRLDRRRPR
jgi:hypothetical protein